MPSSPNAAFEPATDDAADTAPPVARAEHRLETLERLAITAEARLDESGHAKRVGELAALLAAKIGLPGDEVERIRAAAPLHDIGMLGVPDKILFKPGTLTGDEREAMEAHTRRGAEILSHGSSELLDTARTIALTHHERFDGSGYPRGLVGDDIPITGQITAITDFFDTLTRRRPYRRAYGLDEAVEKLRRRAGTEFNPVLVTAFMQVLTNDRAQRTHGRPAPGLTFGGTVDLDTLVDLLTSLGHNAKSGLLRLYLDFSEATVAVHEGRVTHAEYAGLVGDRAVARVFETAQKMGAVEFELVPWPHDAPAPTVSTSMQTVLMEAAVALDHGNLDVA